MKKTLDVVTLKRSIETRNADALIALYHDTAELSIIDRNTQPRHPRKIRGKSAIAEYLKDVCDREMTHLVENTMVDGAKAAFTEACEYPDGTKVYCATILDVDGGKIVRQVNVQAWDE